MNNNDKSKKERLFCCYYAKLGNIFEAAVRAGFSPDTALVNGMDILKQKKYQKSISVLMSETVSPSKLVKAGLERLAFRKFQRRSLLSILGRNAVAGKNFFP